MNLPHFLLEVISQAIFSAAGFGFAYLGYRLLSSPVEVHKAERCKFSLLKWASQLPCGTWFAVFGAMIVLICLVHSFWIPVNETFDGASNSKTEIFQSSATASLLGVGMLFSTVALVLLTGWYAWSTHRYAANVQEQFKSQTAPCVIAFTQPNPNRDWAVDIVIKNFGQGIAKDIVFERHGGVPEETWNAFLQPVDTRTPMNHTVIAEGIPTLPPGGAMVVPWDQAGFQLRPALRMICKYKKLGYGSDKDDYSTECILENYPESILQDKK